MTTPRPGLQRTSWQSNCRNSPHGEVSKFTDSGLLDVRPVVVPAPQNIVGANDYYMCPWTTEVDGTLVVLYRSRALSLGPGQEQVGQALGHSHGGDLFRWRGRRGPNQSISSSTQVRNGNMRPSGASEAGIGSHQGCVYVALNEGLYVSRDKGKSWELVADQPSFGSVPHTIWAPGGRLTFDEEHGLIIWSTRGFSRDVEQRKKGQYGTHLVALYSPDFGKSWEYEEQALPDGLRLSEVTPLRFEGKTAFFLRNGFKNVRYGQGLLRDRVVPVPLRPQQRRLERHRGYTRHQLQPRLSATGGRGPTP